MTLSFCTSCNLIPRLLRTRSRRAWLSFPVGLFFCLILANCTGEKTVAGPILEAEVLPLAEISEAPMRVVWMRMIEGEGKDPFGHSKKFHLMGYDNREGKERTILNTLANYHKPILTSDGERIIYSSYPDNEFYIVNWDGSGNRKLGVGLAFELWKDPSGVEWIYYFTQKRQEVLDKGKPVLRCRIDQPETVEMVWDATEVTPDNFQVTRDGKKAAGLFPWNAGGMVDLETKRYTSKGKGCWTSMSPDNSYRMWVFDGVHKNLLMKPWGESITRKIYLSNAPGIDHFEVYHPRWSNHVRYMAMTGPYKNKGKYNAIGGGGKQINIYVGRFNETFDAIEAWTQVTHTDEANFFPDIWVQGGETTGQPSPGEAAPSQLASAAASWPSNPEGLRYLWRNNQDANEINHPAGPAYCKARLTGLARFEAFHNLNGYKGGLLATSGQEGLADAVNASGEFSCELAMYLPSSRKPAKLAGLILNGNSIDDGNFALVQRSDAIGHNLHMKLATGSNTLATADEEELFQVYMPVDEVLYLSLTYGDDRLKIYTNGAAYAESRKFSGPAAGWREGLPLQFASLPKGDGDWPGFMENMALYNRVLTPEEIAINAATYRKQMKENLSKMPPSIRLNAKLTEVSPLRGPNDLGAYRRDLVACAYEVVSVTRGELTEKNIAVLHWSVLDREVIPFTRKVGQVYPLVISPKSARPELEGERISNSLEDIDLTEYLDLSDPVR